MIRPHGPYVHYLAASLLDSDRGLELGQFDHEITGSTILYTNTSTHHSEFHYKSTLFETTMWQGKTFEQIGKGSLSYKHLKQI